MLINNHRFFHWLYYKPKKKHYFNIGTGLFIWLFLAITQPFGIYNNNLPNYWALALFLLPFGLAWPLISYLSDYVAIKMLSIKVNENYKVDLKLWVVKLFLLIHIIFLIRVFLSNSLYYDLYEYFELWLACTLLIGFAYLPFMLYAKYLYFHSMVGKKDNQTELIQLIGEGKERLNVAKEQIVYLKSDDNYIDLFLMTANDKVEKIAFRATLKFLEEQLSKHHQFVRIHRSYIVNIHYATSSNRKDSLTIHLGTDEKALPISKKYREAISKLFLHSE